MASADLRDELNCSICQEIYTDPVTLPCGHNYCLFCITKTWDNQDPGDSSCPECRKRYKNRPELKKNLRLCNIAEKFRSTHPEKGETGIFCTYCVHSPVPATKSCLDCEASLCDTHLRVHSKSPEHFLINPTTFLGNKICSIHNKALKLFCFEDTAFLCVHCLRAGHQGHQVETLYEAIEKKKEKVRIVLEKLTSKREKTEKRVQHLQEHMKQVQGKAAGETQRVTSLIRDIKEQLKALETRVLTEISRQVEQVSHSVSDEVQKLEIKNNELSRKIHHIEKLRNMTDPFTVLKEQELSGPAFIGTEDTERDNEVPTVGDLDEGLFSVTLYTGLADIVAGIKKSIYVQEATDILLDIDMASNNVDVSSDLKTASWTQTHQSHQQTSEQFQSNQVLSTRRFSSGRHYWVVEGSKSGWWKVGVAYASTQQSEDQSWIGKSNGSWCLSSDYMKYSVIHDGNIISLRHNPTCWRIRIYLDYEAGRLSFYELSDPVRHLHTFTATFTEPLHAAFWVNWYDAKLRILS
ncbi:E3 ubiquitin/ISG15 ligase TRIM25-like [Rhinophrynus dorsalis]